MTHPTEPERPVAPHATGAQPDDGAAVIADDPHALHAQLATLQRERDVARLDLAWQAERENYMVANGEGGGRSIPTRTSLGCGVLMAIAVIVLTAWGRLPLADQDAWRIHAITLGREPSAIDRWLFVLLGPDEAALPAVVFIVIVAVVTIRTYRKAVAYEAAEIAYRDKRARLLSGDAEPERTASAPPSG